jgi:dipeptidyl aminopeptidase/acylaminoacyl peptidase
MFRKIPPLLFLFSFAAVSAQKPALDHSVYDGWKSLGSASVSSDGKWVSYTINPQEGDGWLYIFNTSNSKKDSVSKGTSLAFSPESRYCAFQVSPSFQDTRNAKKKKLKGDKLPKSSLEIRILSTGESQRIPRVKSFSVPEEKSLWMGYLLEKGGEKKDTAKVDTLKIKPKGKSPKKAPEPEGSEFVILNPIVNKTLRFNDVTEYAVAKGGSTISFIQSVPDTTKKSRITIKTFIDRTESATTVFEGEGTAKKLATDKSGDLVSFIFSSDTAKVKVYELWLSKKGAKAVKIVGYPDRSLFKGWSVSENGTLNFSEDGLRLYFGTARKPVKQPEDTLLPDEKYSVDIWSWNDDVLQPMQKKQLDQDLKKTYTALLDINKGTIIQLADTIVPVVNISTKSTSGKILGRSDLKYRKMQSWDNTGYQDVFLINTQTGVRKTLFENSPSEIYLSPSGDYLLIYDYDKRTWLSMPSEGGTAKVLTSSISYPLFDELNDVPGEPSPYSRPLWVDDRRHVLITDRFDVWSLDLSGIESPANITNGFGRRNNLKLRPLKLDTDGEYISRKDVLYLSAFNEKTKESGFFTLKPPYSGDPVKMIMEKASFPESLTKAKDADVILFQKGTFSSSPELYVTDMSFRKPLKVSVTNPQQDKYNWFTAELVEWNSFDNNVLQGILYKPEDFDPAKKYPMIVYFYERSSDGLYSYVPPAPSPSRINVAYAASNRYLVFIPDIPYKTGYPGESCYNAVVSGTYSLLDKYSFIDRTRIGLDGQSWGGYQIAWLVTRTDLFACAYAGAAVSNMISAYGGIRWESGMSRMFQYEKTQSRIGGTLWEKPMFYVENSPIFYAPKINTPLLLMNNDADGAVPWYQGIEFITALRRLNKPAWMLSYNDEEHNLVKRPAKKDISVRKMQFFDHYLKGVPMPYWMVYGIKQTEKGKISGYELVPDSITIRNPRILKPAIYEDKK